MIILPLVFLFALGVLFGIWGANLYHRWTKSDNPVNQGGV